MLFIYFLHYLFMYFANKWLIDWLIDWLKQVEAASPVVTLIRIEWSLLLCRPHQRLPMLFTGPDNPHNLPFPVEELDSYLIHGSLGPPESATQTGSRSVHPFLQDTSLWPTNTQTDVHARRPNNNNCGSAKTQFLWPNNRLPTKRYVQRRCQWLIHTWT